MCENVNVGECLQLQGEQVSVSVGVSMSMGTSGMGCSLAFYCLNGWAGCAQWKLGTVGSRRIELGGWMQIKTEFDARREEEQVGGPRRPTFPPIHILGMV